MIKLHTINVFLENKTLGHYYEYLCCIIDSAKRNNWKIVNYIPTHVNINDDYIWIKNLYKHSYINNFYNKFLYPIKNFIPFYKIFKSFKNNLHENIVLVDNFSIGQLITIFFATFTSNSKFKLWLILRYDPLKRLFKGNLHRIIFYLFYKMLKIPVTPFVDSELLQENYSQFSKINTYILPIPHTRGLIHPTEPPKNYINCFWPGIMRQGKGLEKIILLHKKILEKKANIKINLCETTKNQFNYKNEQLNFTCFHMDRKTYCKLIREANVVLLPYSSQEYFSRSSGIFVEAIYAGKIVLTTTNTWMAFELKKYNLFELIFNWESEAVVENMLEIINDKKMKKKLSIMMYNYRKYHSIKNYASILKTHI